MIGYIDVLATARFVQGTFNRFMADDFRFVILHHLTPPNSRAPHWDLMLEEAEEGLATWALEEPPRRGLTCDALALPRHRRAYLDYEGPVEGQGEVLRWDYGRWRELPSTGGGRAIRLSGQRETFDLTLTPSDRDPRRWRMSCE